MKRSLVAGLLIATTACQSYSSVALNAVPVGSDVQVSLTDSGSTSIASTLGSRVTQLTGQITSVDSTGLALIVSELTRVGGATELGEGHTVSVPADAIAAVRVQSLSVPRTLLVAGIAVIGTILIGRSLGNGGTGSSVNGPGSGQTGK
jgi:hypothetical protein